VVRDNHEKSRKGALPPWRRLREMEKTLMIKSSTGREHLKSVGKVKIRWLEKKAVINELPKGRRRVEWGVWKLSWTLQARVLESGGWRKDVIRARGEPRELQGAGS